MSVRRDRVVHVALVLAVALVSYALLMRYAEYALLPQVWMLGRLFSLEFSGWSQVGYLCEGYGFAITPSCMGAKFFVASFLILALGYTDFKQDFHKRLAMGAIYYACAMVGTFIVNVLRISISLPFARLEGGQLIHNLISLFLYFSELMLLYIFMQRGIKSHE